MKTIHSAEAQSLLIRESLNALYREHLRAVRRENKEKKERALQMEAPVAAASQISAYLKLNQSR